MGSQPTKEQTTVSNPPSARQQTQHKCKYFADHELTKSQIQFASDIFNQCVNNENNVIVSPCSIFVALLMASIGAQGDTFNEMARALSISVDDSQFTQWRDQTLTSYVSNFESMIEHDTTLAIANRLFMRILWICLMSSRRA